MNDVIDIELKVDIKSIRETIENALELNDNQQLFEKIVEFEIVKKRSIITILKGRRNTT
jgi:hypothetical protein